MSRKLILSGFMSSLLLLSVIAYSLPAFAQGPDNAPGKLDVIAVSGIVPGKDLIVHVIVVVQPGETRNEAAIAALAHQGARPFTSEEFSTIALYWDQFGDSDPGNDKVIQRYNPSNEPDNVNGTEALLNTHDSWNGVTTSSFTFEYGGTTGKCPSLVKECRGPQKFDGNNDVAWLRLSSSSTLGVTWTGTSTDEADMALNTSFDWYSNGTVFYDVETVFLHENGHALGLGHETVEDSIMAPYYSTVERTLKQDDKDGITFLYPISNVPVEDPEPDPDPEPIPGESSVNSIAYSLAGGKNNDKHLLITIHVVNGSEDVAGANVSISISNDNSRVGWSGSGTTGTDGQIIFQLSNARSGCYTTVVDSVISNPSWNGVQPQDDGLCKS